MISLTSKGDFKNFEEFAKRSRSNSIIRILNIFGKQGVAALSSATPKDTGATASSWRYEIETRKNGYSLNWYNTEVTKDGTPIAILLQYGHGTRGGTWVEGIDYINPAMRNVFERFAEAIWKEVSK